MADTASPKSVEIASGEIISMQMRKNGSNEYAPIVQIDASDLGGLLKHSFINVATSADATNFKSSAGVLYGIEVFSIIAKPVYFKFYNSASTPTAGSGTPHLRFGIPEEVTSGSGHEFSKFYPLGITFDTGLGFTLVDGITDAASGTVTAANVIANIYYK